jgi:hypothetical protein
VFEADEEGELVLAFWRGGEELDLVVASAEVEATGDAEGLDIGEGRVD